ncbi:hypothetical protein B7463_g8951, partial [Scytalidium lignicola]
MWEALGFKNSLTLTGDGEKFRKLRKAYGSFLSMRNSLVYRDTQLQHARQMAGEIERCPEEWRSYISRFAIRVIFSMAFAIDIIHEDDPYVKLTDEIGWIIANMGNNGITIMDIAPWNEVIRNFKPGRSKPSFIGRLVEARKTCKTDKKEDIKYFTDAELKGTGGSLYAAGQDTTNSTMMIFVMAMVRTQRIVYETLRFHQAVPDCIPHKTLKEDVYRGMYIPKTNAWAMLHDPDIYRDPFEFNPDRFLPASEGGANEPLPVGQFGFVCPGQYLGLASLWIAVATMLAKFNILPSKDENGDDIMPKMEFTTGVTSHPVPFSCIFTPRNDL